MLSLTGYKLSKPHFDILQHLPLGCSFMRNKIFQFISCLWPILTDLGLQVSQEKVITRG